MKRTRKEVKEWLLENRVDCDGDLNLTGLDFSDFKGDIYINEMRTQGNLIQSGQKVEGNLLQGGQIVGKDLHQDNQRVYGNYWNIDNRVFGDINDDFATKLELKKITSKELAKMGYVYVEEV